MTWKSSSISAQRITMKVPELSSLLENCMLKFTLCQFMSIAKQLRRVTALVLC